MSDTPTVTTTSLPYPLYPDALRPHGPISPPNEPIPLYTGPIEFTQKGKTFRADGCVYLAWLPSPAIRFEAHNLPKGVYPTLENLSFRLDDGTAINCGLVAG